MLTDYLVSRAQAALDTVSGLEKGHAQYLASSEGELIWRWCGPVVSVGFLQLELPGVGLSRRQAPLQEPCCYSMADIGYLQEVEGTRGLKSS